MHLVRVREGEFREEACPLSKALHAICCQSGTVYVWHPLSRYRFVFFVEGEELRLERVELRNSTHGSRLSARRRHERSPSAFRPEVVERVRAFGEEAWKESMRT